MKTWDGVLKERSNGECEDLYETQMETCRRTRHVRLQLD